MKQFFEANVIPVADWVEVLVDWLVLNGGPVFTLIRWPVATTLDKIESFLLILPVPVVVLAILGIGWYTAGRWVGVFSALGLILVGFLGFWDATMSTMGMIVTAVAFCAGVGIPLGILAAQNDRFESILRPVLDAMQTVHPFVYLVPVVMFFGIGKAPGTMASIIFALPPLVRLTNLGIRQVPPGVIEGAQAFGATSSQLLIKVKLPLAWPTIMAGLNQTLMMALSMVVIVALIAGGGLGTEIYRAVGRMQVGHAAASGLAVLILAVVLDRISQVRRSSPRRRA
jgi:glycine betaine/proline transport system permease protein